MTLTGSGREWLGWGRSFIGVRLYFPAGSLRLETFELLILRRLAYGQFVLGPLTPLQVPAGFAVGLSLDGRVRATGAESLCYPLFATFTLVVMVVFPAFSVVTAPAFLNAFVVLQR